jgi:transposase
VDLTDEQWRVLEPLFPEPAKRADRRGRPWRGTREVINGVLCFLALLHGFPASRGIDRDDRSV